MNKLAFPGLALALVACGSNPSGGQASAPAAAATLSNIPQVAAMADDQPDQVVPPTSAEQMSAQRIKAMLNGAWRPRTDKARDSYRHPLKTLGFFGIRPDMTVIEITPGGGWYACILAPFLRDNGQYVAAVFAPLSDDAAGKDHDSLRKRFANNPNVYGKARTLQLEPNMTNLAAAGSVDMVLTFRNAHNWVRAGTAETMFKAFFKVLKAGGTLGLVDHRAAADEGMDAAKGSGYLPQDYVIKLAVAAGFKLDARSEINANPNDTKDYPKGVWTLPPTLALGDQDKAKYQAIGESDRMTLRFVKPVRPAAASSTATGY